MTEGERALAKQVEALLKQIEALKAENALLRQKIEALIKKLFGSSSEKISPDQLLLMLGDESQGQAPESAAVAAAAAVAALEAEIKKGEHSNARPKKACKARDPRDLNHLPVENEIIIPEEVLADPEAWRHIGDETTTQLDYQLGRFYRRCLIRQKFVRKDQPFSSPVIAPLTTLQDRSIAAPGLLAQIIVSKYCDHLPHYRQESIYLSRYGISITRQSMGRWMGLAADWLKPIYKAIKGSVFAGNYFQADETPIEYLSPGNKTTKTGYLWAFHRPGVDTFFAWNTSRGAKVLTDIVPEESHGIMQSDRYAAYGAYNTQRAEKFIEAACWAHARREFYEAKASAPQQCAWVLLQIQHLYGIERTLREKNAGPRLRNAIRQSQSRMIIRRLHRAFIKWTEGNKHLPQSAFIKAINYCLNAWKELQTYLEHGQVEIDNNLVENAIRPTAIGKKNWLFIGDEAVGERGAILYTIIESCRRRKIDPWSYLRDVLTRLPKATTSEVPQLTPAEWHKAQTAPPQTRAA